MDLKGKTVVLTGASGGIGSALCMALVAAGATVMAVGRSAARLAVLAGTQPQGRVIVVAADLSTAAGRAHLLEMARAQQPKPAVLVLGHARSAFGLFEEQSAVELEAVMQANLVAPMLLVQDFLPLLSAQPEASVVAVGSTFGSIGFAGFAGYSASKFGLRGLFEALAREHADGSVRFQYLSPRATRTAFNTAAVDALNAELRTSSDTPEAVAAQLVQAIVQGDTRRQLGWPEKFFARLNGAFPALVDRSLRAQLPTIRRHARGQAHSPIQEPAHEPSSP